MPDRIGFFLSVNIKTSLQASCGILDLVDDLSQFVSLESFLLWKPEAFKRRYSCCDDGIDGCEDGDEVGAEVELGTDGLDLRS